MTLPLAWETYLVATLLVVALVAFISERLSPDTVAMGVWCSLAAVHLLAPKAQLPSLDELLGVFANPAPVTIAAMFIISTALEQCGLIEALAKRLQRLIRHGYLVFMLAFVLLIAFFSSFMNNTAIVMIMLPVAMNLAKTSKLAPSKLLIPVSYGAIFGGCCTAIGTSTNLLASTVMVKEGLAPLGMLELSPVAIPLTLMGALYLGSVGLRWLPNRESLGSLLHNQPSKEYLQEAFIPADSPWVGMPVHACKPLFTAGLRLVELVRAGVSYQDHWSQLTLAAGDRITLACSAQSVLQARRLPGVQFQQPQDAQVAQGSNVEPISTYEAHMVEAIIPAPSRLIGQSIGNFPFRQQFRALVLAVHRKGHNLRQKLKKVYFQVGDTLLLMATESVIAQLHKSPDLVLLSTAPCPVHDRSSKAPRVITVLSLVILLSVLDWVPIAAGAVMGAFLLVATRCIRTQDLYRCIEWRILVIVYGMLALGLAMEKSELSNVMAFYLAQLGHSLPVPLAAKPYALLALVYLCTNWLTEILTNNATILIMAPIAIDLAQLSGLSPRPFALAACLASSASFASPIGYQTNTYVYSIGNYRFKDFLRIGLPLNVLFFVACMLLIPWLWPLN